MGSEGVVSSLSVTKPRSQTSFGVFRAYLLTYLLTSKNTSDGDKFDIFAAHI